MIVCLAMCIVRKYYPRMICLVKILNGEQIGIASTLWDYRDGKSE